MRRFTIQRIATLAATICFLGGIIFLVGCSSITSGRLKNKEPYIHVVKETQLAGVTASRMGIFYFANAFHGEKVGYDVANIAVDHLMSHHFVQNVALTPPAVFDDKLAVKMAVDKQYDIILIGRVDDFYEGGISSDSRVAVSIKILNVRSGQLLWYLTGAIQGKGTDTEDYFLFEKKGCPAPSAYSLVVKLLEAMLNEVISKNS
ncbi:MAG: hypothetical protein V2B19_21255 [Pseudomonadota bacterium]